MKVGIDMGASLTKIVVEVKGDIIKRICFSSGSAKITDFVGNVDEVFITGGNSKKYPGIINGVKPTIKNEIKCIVNGVALSDCLICSIGTGTCIIDVNDKKGTHIGGTAIGGGTYRGLVKLLTDVNDFHEMEKLSKKGDLSKVDLSVKDIVGKGMGILDESITASNFGSFDISLKKEDLIRASANLVAESVFSTVFFAARSVNKVDIAFVGKVAEVEFIREKLNILCSKFGLNAIFFEDGAYRAARGALI